MTAECTSRSVALPEDPVTRPLPADVAALVRAGWLTEVEPGAGKTSVARNR